MPCSVVPCHAPTLILQNVRSVRCFSPQNSTSLVLLFILFSWLGLRSRVYSKHFLSFGSVVKEIGLLQVLKHLPSSFSARLSNCITCLKGCLGSRLSGKKKKYMPANIGDAGSVPQFSSVQSLTRVWLFATPWIAARQASLPITNSRSSLRLTSI